MLAIAGMLYTEALTGTSFQSNDDHIHPSLVYLTPDLYEFAFFYFDQETVS